MSQHAPIPKAIVRRYVREVLNMRPGYGKTEKQLLDYVNDLNSGGVDLQELRDGMDWNHGLSYIRREFNKEAEEYLWFITESGIAQQHIK